MPLLEIGTPVKGNGAPRSSESKKAKGKVWSGLSAEQRGLSETSYQPSAFSNQLGKEKTVERAKGVGPKATRKQGSASSEQ